MFRGWRWRLLVRNFCQELVLSLGSAGPAFLRPLFLLSPWPLVAFKMVTLAFSAAHIGDTFSRCSGGFPFLSVSLWGATEHPTVSGISPGKLRWYGTKCRSRLQGPSWSGVHGRDSGGLGTVPWIKSLQLGCACLTLLLLRFELGTAAIWCLH